MSGRAPRSAREIVNNELERQLNSVGMSLGPLDNQVVFLNDRETAVPWQELEQRILLLRAGYSALPTAHAWGRRPAPRHPPGLPAPSAENARLWDLIPNEEQSWPAEYREFDARYSMALQPAPTFSIMSAGGPIRRPTPPPTVPTLQVFGADMTSRMAGAVDSSRALISHGPPLSASAPIFVPRASLAPALNPPPPAPAALGMGVPAASGSVQHLPPTGSATGSSPVPAPDMSASGIVVNLPPVAVPNSSADAELRMVVIRYVPTRTTLEEISQSISSKLYGAVYSIRFWMEGGRRRVAEIIFRDTTAIGTTRHATPGAVGYYTALIDASNQPWDDRDKILWPFSRRWVLSVTLENFPANDIIRAMRPQHQLRTAEPEGTELTTTGSGAAQPQTQTLSRRISLVGRGGLFNHLREKDILNILLRGRTILPYRVERICIYNSGNGTIIFADVETAVAAMRHFDEYNRQSTALRQVQASYSKCPSETLVQFTVDGT